MPHSPVPPESLTPQQRELIAERYGVRSGVSWPFVAAIAITAMLFIAWVLWAGWGQADQDVRWRTVGYTSAGTDSVTVEFDVFKPRDEDVECIVRALDIDSKEVGRAEVLVTASEPDVSVTYDLPVTERPNTAEVLECRIDPSRSTSP